MSKNWETEVKPPPIADHTRRDIDVSSLASMGNTKNPKLTLVECSDFDCPYCTRGAELVKAVFEHEKYKDITAFYFANFPLPMHKTADAAHRAAIAAGNQGKFFEMHDLLFEDRTKRTEDDFRAMAGQLSLDVDKFITDWNSEATKQRILDDKALCSKHGVSGTPNFFVNGRSMRGAVPIQMAAQVFEEELAGGFEALPKAEKDDAKAEKADAKAEKVEKKSNKKDEKADEKADAKKAG
jgi:protein-disulfide isomerase